MNDAQFATMFERTMARRRGQRTGNITERCGAWYLRYRIDTPDIGPDGKQVRPRIMVRLAPSKGPGAIGIREARRIAWDDYLSRLDQASLRPGSMLKLGEFIERRWWPDVVEHLKPATKSFYKSLVRKHIVPALGERPMRECNLPRIQDFLNEKARSGLSTMTVHQLRTCLSGIFRHARAMECYFGELPTESARTPEVSHKEKRALNWDQVSAISGALPEPISTLVVILALTGLRIGEAVAIRVRRLNNTGDFAIVEGDAISPHSISIRENYVMGQYQTLKTRRSMRDAPVPEWFWPRILALLDREEWTSGDCPLFASRNGTPLDHHNVANRMLKPAVKSLGLEWVSWHSFRHTFATLADRAGLSSAERMKLMGHATEAVTFRYTHPEYEGVRSKLTGLTK